MSIPPAPKRVQHPPDPGSYCDWDLMPADRRDRAVALRIAAACGIRPRWADRDATAWERMQARVERAERLILRLAQRAA